MKFQMNTIVLAALLILLFASGNITFATEDSAATEKRPNIVLVMVDDMGFSDLGCYGGEIETPNLDKLAKNGLRFTQFYNCAKCETTRSTLLSGRYYPEVKNQKLQNCVTIAEAMKLAGYSTIMTGKWHLQSNPIVRGFDNYFGHLSGATNFFTGDKTFRLNEKAFKVPESGFYTTDANVDYAIKFLDQADSTKPFFLYVAHNAPHYPLQAPEKDVKKYLGKYKMGWDKLREERLARQKKLGIVLQDTKLSPRPKDVPAWDTLSAKQRATEDLMMATFAAMVDRVDISMGRLIEKLKSMGEFENTLILFLSDNGACPFQRTRPKTKSENLMPWNPNSYWTYDKGWAHACNTPFREYKQNQHEGGISTPLIAHWPKRLKEKGKITKQTGHLVDIMATCLDIAGIKYPKKYKGQSVGPPRGKSLVPIFDGQRREPHEYIFFSFYGKNNALRMGDWKLVNRNFGSFELYNIANDRTESNDLRKSNPQKFRMMKGKFDEVAGELDVNVKKRTNRKKNKGKNNKRKKNRNQNQNQKNSASKKGD